MKRSITSFALCTFFAIGAALAAPQDPAQNAPAPEQNQASPRLANPGRQVHMLTKRLNLTADQQQQLLPILSNRDQQVTALRNDATLSRADRHAKMKAIRESADSQIRGVLNDQQKQAYDQLQQQARERMQQRRHEKGSSNNPA